MGRWDDGIFDSDSVLDFLAPFNANLIRTIVFYLADESLSDDFGDGLVYSQGTDTLVAAVELLCHFHEAADLRLVKAPRVVKRWREVCLERFEADPSWDDCQTPDGFDARVERRKVIDATFDRLLALTDEDL